MKEQIILKQKKLHFAVTHLIYFSFVSSLTVTSSRELSVTTNLYNYFACSLNTACIKNKLSKALQLSVEMTISSPVGNNECQVQSLSGQSFSTF